jgi:PQQ-like domain
VYFGSDDSTFYCLEPTGTLRWSYPTGSSIRTSPAVGADGSVYFGTWDGRLIALGETPAVSVPRPVPFSGLFLASPWPSPARTAESVRFRAPPGGTARLDVFDVAGRRVCRMWEGAGDGVDRRATWNLVDDAGRRVPPGVYHLLLAAGAASVSRRLVVLP